MMDVSEQSPLSHIPAQSISMRLVRPVIKMTHGRGWSIDKVNPTHDLVICLAGGGQYFLGSNPKPLELQPGDAMLIPGYTRFRGKHYGGSDRYLGIAQHFTMSLFSRDDLISRLRLKRSVSIPNWNILEPLATHYREVSPLGGTTPMQHHQFMVFLLAYLEAAFIDWSTDTDTQDGQDQLSVQIMRVATRLSADLLGFGLSDVLDDVPYNQDYFRRAFKERMGYTPQKFREKKRMELAATRISMGLSVKAVAAELGYSDPYFFSRMFKRYQGVSPSHFKDKGPLDAGHVISDEPDSIERPRGGTS